jgi:8-amino-7-oxononanoate synthase
LLPDDARAAGVQTLVDVLEYRARQQPPQVVFRFLQSDGREKATITFLELQQRARAVATRLGDLVVPGDRVMLLVPPGLDYIAAFFGCLYAGAIAVPAYPPNPRRADPRVARMAADCGARVALVASTLMGRLDDWLQHSPALRTMAWLDIDQLQQNTSQPWQPPPVTAASLAMLQYTSGSTGEPRGVMVTHANLLHNLSIIHRVTRHRDGDTAVFWLPPFHDMGLIGGILEPIYANVPTVLMAPATFLQRPLVWLETMSRYRGTGTGAPNFAYALCVERISAEERRTLDLSSWRTSYNGAEPINAVTMRRFVETFAECGLRSNVILPCYGLAEGTLIVSGTPVRDGIVPQTVLADRTLLEAGVLRAPRDVHSGSVLLVPSGTPVDEARVVIVDPDTCIECGDGFVGEIWVSGESVAVGYWNQPEATAATFCATLPGIDGAFLRTGDLGVMVNGELIVTGRIKDLVILDGRNYYPHDIEVAAERSHASLRPGYIAAFSVPTTQRERLVVVAEVARAHRAEQNAAVFVAIRTELAATIGIVPDEIVLISPNSIPRTSSGKIQRRACRTALLGGTLEVIAQWKPESHAIAPTATMTAFLIDWVTDELQIDAARLDASSSLRDAGLDSLAATRLLVALETRVGRRINQAELWQQPTIGALASYLTSLDMMMSGAAARREPRAFFAEPTSVSTDVAQWVEYRALRQRLDEIRDGGIVAPFFQVHEGASASTAMIAGRQLVNFANYNYLALSGHPAVTAAAQEALSRYGSSVSASRLVSGERPVHAALELALATFVGAECALVHIGGHPTNVSTISHLMGADDVVLCDEHLHNSAMQGAEFSGARRVTFPHNDWAALDGILVRVRAQHRRALIIIEGVYSADGDIPDLARFLEVKARHHALLMVDEAHSLGVIGQTGRGIGEHARIDPRDVDIWMGTLSKALASCGGYIAGNAALVEYLKYTSPGFVYSVGITPPNAAAALAALEVLVAEPERVDMLRANAAYFLARCRDAGFDTGGSDGTPIVPIIVGDSLRAMRLSAALMEAGVNVQPMIAPAVAEHGARLRFFVSSEHTRAQLDFAVDALATVLSRSSDTPYAAAVARTSPSSTFVP